jgi:hypothetical protein
MFLLILMHHFAITEQRGDVPSLAHARENAGFINLKFLIANTLVFR